MATQTLPSLEEMADAGVHFGHRTSRWHPKMKTYIYGEKEGIHIIDLEKTQAKLKSALEAIESPDVENILFVGTKKQASPVIKTVAERAGIFYVTQRWPGGLITNFTSLLKTINRYEDFLSKKESIESLPNKEKFASLKELERLEKLVGGLKGLQKPPDLLVIVDPKRERTAVKEARKAKIPIIAIIDTNADPTEIDYPIPANDDSIKSIETILEVLVARIATKLDSK